MQLPDCRDLAWSEYGAGDGTPVIAFHGSPGTGHEFAFLSEVAARQGVRLLAPDRPGYGHSTYHRARTYESWARDTGALADHLGFDRFAVVGHSSGGPNAVGCARFLADRLVGCAVVAGPAPPEAMVAKDGMQRTNRWAQRCAPLAPRLCGAIFAVGMRQSQHAPDKALAWMSRVLPPCDVAVTERPDVRSALRAAFARPVAATAGRAAVQDLQLEGRPWGFDLGEIVIAVHVWHGDADRNVVVGSGRYQATAIPNAILHEMPDEGHWMHVSHFDEILTLLKA